MKEFSVVLNDKDPVMVKTMLGKLFVPGLPLPARYLHALMVKRYDMIAALRSEGQTTQFMANLQKTNGRPAYTESLSVVEEGQAENWSVFISQTNKTLAVDLIAPHTTENSYDHNWTAISIHNALLGTEPYDVCLPGHEHTMCTLLLAVIEALKDTHFFNLYVHKGKSLALKCISQVDPTIVMIKTRSWSELALLAHQAQNQRFEGRYTTDVH